MKNLKCFNGVKFQLAGKRFVFQAGGEAHEAAMVKAGKEQIDAAKKESPEKAIKALEDMKPAQVVDDYVAKERGPLEQTLVAAEACAKDASDADKEARALDVKNAKDALAALDASGTAALGELMQAQAAAIVEVEEAANVAAEALARTAAEAAEKAASQRQVTPEASGKTPDAPQATIDPVAEGKMRSKDLGTLFLREATDDDTSKLKDFDKSADEMLKTADGRVGFAFAEGAPKSSLREFLKWSILKEGPDATKKKLDVLFSDEKKQARGLDLKLQEVGDLYPIMAGKDGNVKVDAITYAKEQGFFHPDMNDACKAKVAAALYYSRSSESLKNIPGGVMRYQDALRTKVAEVMSNAGHEPDSVTAGKLDRTIVEFDQDWLKELDKVKKEEGNSLEAKQEVGDEDKNAEKKANIMIDKADPKWFRAGGLSELLGGAPISTLREFIKQTIINEGESAAQKKLDALFTAEKKKEMDRGSDFSLQEIGNLYPIMAGKDGNVKVDALTYAKDQGFFKSGMSDKQKASVAAALYYSRSVIVHPADAMRYQEELKTEITKSGKITMPDVWSRTNNVEMKTPSDAKHYEEGSTAASNQGGVDAKAGAKPADAPAVAPKDDKKAQAAGVDNKAAVPSAKPAGSTALGKGEVGSGVKGASSKGGEANAKINTGKLGEVKKNNGDKKPEKAELPRVADGKSPYPPKEDNGPAVAGEGKEARRRSAENETNPYDATLQESIAKEAAAKVKLNMIMAASTSVEELKLAVQNLTTAEVKALKDAKFLGTTNKIEGKKYRVFSNGAMNIVPLADSSLKADGIPVNKDTSWPDQANLDRNNQGADEVVKADVTGRVKSVNYRAPLNERRADDNDDEK